jgi:uncharacterized linocin/CFP29 family protein
MADTNSGLRWSQAQWDLVNNAITESFAKASVVSTPGFLPSCGPLAESAENVRAQRLLASLGVRAPAKPQVSVTDDDTLRLFNLRVLVQLLSEQVADDSLSSALLAFRRAANALAQVEDDLVFNGYGDDAAGKPRKDLRDKLTQLAAFPALIDPEVVANKPGDRPGLIYADKPAPDTADDIIASNGRRQKSQLSMGEHIVQEVACAIGDLERDSHPGPFACVLGTNAFVAVYTPTNSMVLPADRITPILNGPLLRSGRMVRDHGIVVSLGGNDIDIVVASPPKAQFLQVTDDAKYLFRVYERFVWRIKDRHAVRGISL